MTLVSDQWIPLEGLHELPLIEELQRRDLTNKVYLWERLQGAGNPRGGHRPQPEARDRRAQVKKCEMEVREGDVVCRHTGK